MYSIDNKMEFDMSVDMPRLVIDLIRNGRRYSLTVLVMDHETVYLGGRAAAGVIWGTYARQD